VTTDKTAGESTDETTGETTGRRAAGIAPLRALVSPAERRGWVRYLLAVGVYAVSEGAAFGLFVPVLTALLRHRTATAGWWLIPLGVCAAGGWLAHYDLGLRALRLSSAWRRELYDRIGGQLLRLPLGWFDTPSAERVPQLVIGDVARVAGTVLLAQPLLAAVLTPATVTVFLAGYDWRLGLAALIAVPVVLAAFLLGRRITERTETAHHAAGAEAGARLVEFAAAQPTLRAAGQTAAGRRALDEALAGQHAAARREVAGSLPGQYLGRLGIQLAFTAVLVTGLALHTAHHLGAARMIALVVLGISLVRPLDGLVLAGTALRACQSSAERIGGLLNVAPLPEPAAGRTDDAYGTGAGAAPAGGIELDGVHFGYPGGEPVLRGVDLTVPAGRTTALVGPSGAGKTTVTKLIARFHDVTAGAVRIDGVDVRELSARALLDRIALVFQDVHLFDTTIEENIRYGDPDTTDEQVREAARRARVDSIVERLPGGWASRVGEGGRLLSGGERQRVAIARALCKNAPIVLLDEATAALDPENEAAVHAALAELAADRTVLVIAHRLDTIASADRIAVLDGGRVVETGRHADLLAAGGRYAAFWTERTRARGWRLSAPHNTASR
jgi:ATP-binding cassette subfamily B protein